jgi:hypothetical protein
MKRICRALASDQAGQHSSPSAPRIHYKLPGGAAFAATCVQLIWLAVISKRKWIPPQIRLSPSSCDSAEKLLYGSE